MSRLTNAAAEAGADTVVIDQNLLSTVNSRRYGFAVTLMGNAYRCRS
jgi:hypothetical protein